MTMSYQSTGLSKLPFNIELLKLTGQNTLALKPIKVSDIYDGGTTNFHEDGLYSVSIFGPSGTKDRSNKPQPTSLFNGIDSSYIQTLSSIVQIGSSNIRMAALGGVTHFCPTVCNK